MLTVAASKTSLGSPSGKRSVSSTCGHEWRPSSENKYQKLNFKHETGGPGNVSKNHRPFCRFLRSG